MIIKKKNCSNDEENEMKSLQHRKSWLRKESAFTLVCLLSVCLSVSLSLTHTHTHTYTHRGKGNDPCRAKFEMLTGWQKEGIRLDASFSPHTDTACSATFSWSGQDTTARMVSDNHVEGGQWELRYDEADSSSCYVFVNTGQLLHSMGCLPSLCCHADHLRRKRRKWHWISVKQSHTVKTTAKRQ